jgi:sugar/nucleoside kinase (ribokinase family)
VSPPRALVIGAVSRDLGPEGGATGRPGGVVVHAGCALARLGAATRVVTRVHPDDAATLLAPLAAEGVAVAALPSRHTTTYVNDYAGAVDAHVLREASDPIGPDDVPPAWRTADLVQLGPLHSDDVLPETAALLAGLRGLDVQGLVRKRGTPALRASASLALLLPHVDVVKASEPELLAMLDGDSVERFVARHAVRELLVTRGAAGVTVMTAARRVEVPAVPARGTARVGAGDVFLATYLLQRARGDDPVTAARAAAHVAALKIEHGTVPADALR